MGFFSGDSGSVEVQPQAPWQRKGIKQLLGLLGTTPDIPTRQISGMSDVERAGQGQLMDFVSGRAARDPSTSPYYRSMQQASMAEENRGADIMRRRAQLGGGFRSSDAGRAEGLFRTEMANQRLGLLGQMLEQQWARDNPLARAMAASQYGGISRILEQQQQDAVLNALMQQIAFPYQTQAPIAQSLMGHQPTMYMTQPEQSGFGSLMPLLGGAGGAIAGGILGAPFGPLGIGLGASMGANVGGNLGGAAGNAWG